MTIGQGVATSLTQLGMASSQFGIAQVPVLSPLPAGGKAIETHVAGINLVVRQSTQHEKAALELVKFMTSPAEQVTINNIYGTLPVVTAAYDNPEFQNPTTKVYQQILESHSAPMPRYPSESQMESQLGGALTSLIAQSASTGTVPSTTQIMSALQTAQQKLIASTGGQ
jgi:multiple sugar transport system substrate-binding protein